MNEGAAGVGLLILVAALSAVLWHLRVRDHWRATCGSAVQAGLTWLAVVYAIQGSRDPFLLVAGIFAIFWAFVIAYLVGLVFRAWR
jgi:hypothetical protein